MILFLMTNAKCVAKIMVMMTNSITPNGFGLCAAALNKLNNSALTIQRWHKTAVISWCGLITKKWN